ncbi:hypothetical protein [Robertmurraya sp. FSL R5-0851]|uniref:hypothetical protein n=1 Tax=Robertmurraya sp. FSL R5-0851 TaxID=2921584 RepID=UPI0030F74829
MYKLKRHRILNLYYLHSPYSGSITEEYEVVEEVEDFVEGYTKLEEYRSNNESTIDGIFEDYYKYEHMKCLWGDVSGIQPTIGQLFFVCRKEAFGKWRTLYELCEVKEIHEYRVIYKNHASNKVDKMTIGTFQDQALFPTRDQNFIQEFEIKTGLTYPKNLISLLDGVKDYRKVMNRKIALTNGVTNWDLSKDHYQYALSMLTI